ncbi:MAG: DUF3899 domain-containing protein [Sphaerochaetaceae bacterium]|mgnify:FL=1|nr:DUF3899 domain-containing protein [Sphaerochaetaceae bacterium]
MKIKSKKLIICYVVCLVLSIIVAFVRGIVGVKESSDLFLILSDSFFTSGALMLIAGGLVWTNSQGVSDGLTYSVSRFFGRRGTGYEDNRRESFAEYRERKHANSASVIEFMISGLSFVAIALVLMLAC